MIENVGTGCPGTLAFPFRRGRPNSKFLCYPQKPSANRPPAARTRNQCGTEAYKLAAFYERRDDPSLLVMVPTSSPILVGLIFGADPQVSLALALVEREWSAVLPDG